MNGHILCHRQTFSVMCVAAKCSIAVLFLSIIVFIYPLSLMLPLSLTSKVRNKTKLGCNLVQFKLYIISALS